jgi:outer membrane protein TolC
VIQSPSQKILGAKYRLRSAGLLYDVAQDDEKSDIYLQAGGLGHRLDRNEGTDEDKEYKPRSFVALGIEITFGDSAAESKSLSSYKDLKLAELGLTAAQDDVKSKWINQCSRLKLLKRRQSHFTRIVRDLRERERLQESRFRLGRVSAFDVYRASVGVTENVQSLSQIRSERKKVSWQLLTLVGEMSTHIQRVYPESKVWY